MFCCIYISSFVDDVGSTWVYCTSVHDHIN